MTSKLKTDVLETGSGSGTIALNNQLSGMTSASLPTLTAAEMPAGSIINVYTHDLGTATIQTSSTSFVATGLTITLTPVDASSRFYISYTSSPHLNSGNSTAWGQHFVFRGSQVLGIGGGERYDSRAGWVTKSQTVTGVDSPNTTSAITYTVQMNNSSNNYHFHVGGHLSGGSSAGTNVALTILEIKG